MCICIFIHIYIYTYMYVICAGMRTPLPGMRTPHLEMQTLISTSTVTANPSFIGAQTFTDASIRMTVTDTHPRRRDTDFD